MSPNFRLTTSWACRSEYYQWSIYWLDLVLIRCSADRSTLDGNLTCSRVKNCVGYLRLRHQHFTVMLTLKIGPRNAEENIIQARFPRQRKTAPTFKNANAPWLTIGFCSTCSLDMGSLLTSSERDTLNKRQPSLSPGCHLRPSRLSLSRAPRPWRRELATVRGGQAACGPPQLCHQQLGASIEHQPSGGWRG